MYKRGFPRHVIALTTVGLATWVGLTLVTAKPILGGLHHVYQWAA